MQAIVIAQIIGVFYKANILTAQFLTVLEQQILRVYLSFDGTDTSRILFIFTNFEVGSEELMKCLCKQAKLSLYTMDLFSTINVLICFIKIGKGDQVEDIERQVLLLSQNFSFYNFSEIVYKYAKFIPIPLKNNTDRRKFVIELCNIIENDENLISKEFEKKTLIHALYGLAVGKIFEFPRLWTLIVENFEKKGGAKTLDEGKMLLQIKKILEDNGQTNLLK